MKEKVRSDSKRVRLRTGEYERSDRRYEYRYTVFGKEYFIYAKTLEALREKETSLDSEGRKKWNANPYSTTINNVYIVWKELKRGVRDNTFRNYCYMYETYVKNAIGEQYITSIKKSDVKRFFNYLKDERNLKLGTIDGVHTVLHQVLQTAVDDEGLDHFLDHLSADGTCLFRGKVSVVSLLKINADFVRSFHLKLGKSSFSLGNEILIVCHYYSLLCGKFSDNFSVAELLFGIKRKLYFYI